MADSAARHQDAFAQIAEEVRAWRRAHPAATLTEIEEELDTRLRVARAALLADVASDGAGNAAPDAARCPTCGGPLVARGTRRRTLITDGDAAVLLTRPYATCPACGTGLFPPR